ncbi:MAG: Prolyl endopeptidase, partial [uncultured Corynebacteriales bacterium]
DRRALRPPPRLPAGRAAGHRRPPARTHDRRPVPLAGGRGRPAHRGLGAGPGRAGPAGAGRAARPGPAVGPADHADARRQRPAADVARRAGLLLPPAARPGARGAAGHRCRRRRAGAGRPDRAGPGRHHHAGRGGAEHRGRPARVPAVHRRRRGVPAVRAGRRHRRAARRPRRPVPLLPRGLAARRRGVLLRPAAGPGGGAGGRGPVPPAGVAAPGRRRPGHRRRGARRRAGAHQLLRRVGLPGRPLAAGHRLGRHRAAGRRLDRRPGRGRRPAADPARRGRPGVPADRPGRAALPEHRPGRAARPAGPGRPGRPRVRQLGRRRPRAARRRARGHRAAVLGDRRRRRGGDPGHALPGRRRHGVPLGPGDRDPDRRGRGGRRRQRGRAERPARGRPGGVDRLHRPRHPADGAALERRRAGAGRGVGDRAGRRGGPGRAREPGALHVQGRHPGAHVRRGADRRAGPAAADDPLRLRRLQQRAHPGVHAVDADLGGGRRGLGGGEPARRLGERRGVAPRRHARAQAERVRRLRRGRRAAGRRRLDQQRPARHLRRLQRRPAGRGRADPAPRAVRRGRVQRAAAGHGALRAVRPRPDLERRVRHRGGRRGARLARRVLALPPGARGRGLPGGAVHHLRQRHPGGPDARPEDVRGAAARDDRDPAGAAAPGEGRRPRRPLGEPHGRAEHRPAVLLRRPAGAAAV